MSPFRPDEPWTCETAASSVKAVLDHLRSRRVVQQAPHPDVIDRLTERCGPCTAGRGNERNCEGWKFGLRDSNALVLNLLLLQRPVTVTVDGYVDRRHPRGRQAHEAVPNEGSWSVTVVSAESRDVLFRQHLDVANPGQHGPVSHLQLGGQIHGVERSEWSRIEQPRWPVVPMDLTLISELLLYSFAHGIWLDIRHQQTWVQWMQRSESLCWSLWFQRHESYWFQRNSGETWLSTQCNQASPWPRLRGN
jgi:hypothetical protein